MLAFLFVGLGGAIGAMLRYAISLIPVKSAFPILTLMTNVIGAFLIGMIVAYALKREVSPNTLLFLKTGVCGGFTTFSTFSLEAYTLFKDGKPVHALTYALLSLVLCVLAVSLGERILVK